MEEWKDIKGYEGFYMVSSLGRVKSLDKIDFMKRNNCQRVRKGFILKPGSCNKYPSICLYLNKKPKTINIHRLVAINFIQNPENKAEVNHINGIKTDNRVENLEWCTSSENTIHAIKNGFVNQKRGSDIVTSKLKEHEVKEIKNSSDSLSSLAIKYNISASVISNIKNNKSWKHV